jgi:large subunit ribosomal protein L24
MSLRIRKNDRVEVITGRDKGRVARVLYVVPKKAKAVVENVNMVAKHVRARGKAQGGIQHREAPIHLSNLMLYCDKCKAGVRFGIKEDEAGKEKQRVCKKCGSAV